METKLSTKGDGIGPEIVDIMKVLDQTWCLWSFYFLHAALMGEHQLMRNASLTEETLQLAKGQ